MPREQRRRVQLSMPLAAGTPPYDMPDGIRASAYNTGRELSGMSSVFSRQRARRWTPEMLAFLSSDDVLDLTHAVRVSTVPTACRTIKPEMEARTAIRANISSSTVHFQVAP